MFHKKQQKPPWQVAAEKRRQLQQPTGEPVSQTAASGQHQPTANSSAIDSTTTSTPSTLVSYASSDDDDEEATSATGTHTTHSSTGNVTNDETLQGEDEADNEEPTADDVAIKEDYIQAVIAQYQLPITETATLTNNGHIKACNTVALDHSGSRLLSGGSDYFVKFWDYNQMTDSLTSFREIEVEEGHPIKYLQFNSSSELFVVLTGSLQPRVYNRDGFLQYVMPRGDTYLLDQRHTRGATGEVLCAVWHPTETYTCLTAGRDGCLRVWNVGPDAECQQDKTLMKNTMVLKLQRVQRSTAVTALTISSDGQSLACATTDGNIHLLKGPLSPTKISQLIPNAHTKTTETTSLLFTHNNKYLISRGGDNDNTVKVWNVSERVLSKTPVAVFSNLPNGFPTTNLALNADGSMLMTSTSLRSVSTKNIDSEKDQIQQTTSQLTDIQYPNHLLFIDTHTWVITLALPASQTPNTSITSCSWHPTLNQIVTGMSDGTVRMYYSAEYSKKGVMLSVSRVTRAKSFMTTAAKPVIITPHAPDYQQQMVSRKRQRDNSNSTSNPPSAKSQTRQHIPSLHQDLLNKLVQPSAGRENARESFLQHAGATDDPIYTKAYQKTQPAPIFQQVADGDEKR